MPNASISPVVTHLERNESAVTLLRESERLLGYGVAPVRDAAPAVEE